MLRLDDLHISVHHGAATAVRGVSLRVRAGRDRRAGRGVRQRQDADLPGRPRRAACRLRHRAGHGVVRRPGRDHAVPAWLGAGARQPDRRRVPGPRVLPEPVAHRGQPAGRGAAGEAGRSPGARPGTGAIELFETVGLHRPEWVYQQIPAELSGGMLQRVMIAIAICVRPAAAGGRRAHYRAGRHHPGRGHRAAAAAARGARAGRAVRVPRPGRDQPALRPDRGVLRRGNRGVRARRGDHRAAPAPLHPGAAAGGLGRRLPPPRAGGHRRAAAAGGRGHHRMPVRRALPGRGPGMRAGAVHPVPVGDRHQVRCVHAARAVAASDRGPPARAAPTRLARRRCWRSSRST